MSETYTVRTGGPRLRKDGEPDMRFRSSRAWAAWRHIKLVGEQPNELLNDLVWRQA